MADSKGLIALIKKLATNPKPSPAFKNAINQAKALEGRIERDVTPIISEAESGVAAKLEREAAEAAQKAKPSPIIAEEMAAQQTDYGKVIPEAVQSSKSNLGRNALRAATGAAALGGAGYMMFGGDGEPPVPPQETPTFEPEAKPQDPAPASAPGQAVAQIQRKAAAKPLDLSIKTRQADALARLAAQSETTEPKTEETKAEKAVEKQPQFLDFGTQDENRNELAEVQQRQNEAEFVNALGRAADRVGSGISMTTPQGQEGFDANIKMAQNITQQYMDRQANQENDPTSGASKAARDYIKKFGVNVSDGASAAQLKQVMPYVFKDFESRQSAEEKRAALQDKIEARKQEKQMQDETNRLKVQLAHEDNQARRAEIGARLRIAQMERQDRAEQRKQDQLFKDQENLVKRLDSGWAARGGQAGAVQAKIIQAEALEALIDQTRAQPGGADSRQIEELSIGAARMLGGGAPAMATIEKLTPRTATGRIQTLKEFLSNEPTGQQAQEFTERLADTIRREKEVANRQKLQFQVETLPASSRLKQQDPEAYRSILEAKGISPDMIDEKGRYKAPKKEATPMPAVGETKDGYTFKGGNPADPRNWEK